jgi:hypothetical protein
MFSFTATQKKNLPCMASFCHHSGDLSYARKTVPSASPIVVTPSQLPAIDSYVFLCSIRRKHSLEEKHSAFGQNLGNSRLSLWEIPHEESNLGANPKRTEKPPA